MRALSFVSAGVVAAGAITAGVWQVVAGGGSSSGAAAGAASARAAAESESLIVEPALFAQVVDAVDADDGLRAGVQDDGAEVWGELRAARDYLKKVMTITKGVGLSARAAHTFTQLLLQHAEALATYKVSYQWADLPDGRRAAFATAGYVDDISGLKSASGVFQALKQLGDLSTDIGFAMFVTGVGLNAWTSAEKVKGEGADAVLHFALLFSVESSVGYYRAFAFALDVPIVLLGAATGTTDPYMPGVTEFRDLFRSAATDFSSSPCVESWKDYVACGQTTWDSFTHPFIRVASVQRFDEQGQPRFDVAVANVWQKVIGGDVYLGASILDEQGAIVCNLPWQQVHLSPGAKSTVTFRWTRCGKGAAGGKYRFVTRGWYSCRAGCESPGGSCLAAGCCSNPGLLVGFEFAFTLEKAAATKCGVSAKSSLAAASLGRGCAVRGDKLMCWGSQWNGQTSAKAAVVHGLSGTAVDVSAAYHHTCAVLVDGRVACWGHNTYGKLGDGSADPSDVLKPGVKATPALALGIDDATQVAAGHHHTCAVRRNGQVACWGWNSVGQLGLGGSENFAIKPLLVQGLTDAVQVCAGTSHSCAVRASGKVACWGRHPGVSSRVPAEVAVIADAVQVTCGQDDVGGHTCALGREGAVWCWGTNANGEVGDGTTTERVQPAKVGGLDDAVWISAGKSFTCAVRSSGSVVCWGSNASGRIADGAAWKACDHSSHVACLHDPKRKQSECEALVAKATACQAANARATKAYVTPVAIPGVADALQVAAGWDHACAVLKSGGVQCWGAPSYGQLGSTVTATAGKWNAAPASVSF